MDRISKNFNLKKIIFLWKKKCHVTIEISRFDDLQSNGKSTITTSLTTSTTTIATATVSSSSTQ